MFKIEGYEIGHKDSFFWSTINIRISKSGSKKRK